MQAGWRLQASVVNRETYLFTELLTRVLASYESRQTDPCVLRESGASDLID